ncbi:MAG: gliding motility-associated C-terminal domain-containing protein [Bacteroidales bacterium]|nr:gliding motility-associated C-terminal domain-containing protein [Bacteroidales bacterium]
MYGQKLPSVCAGDTAVYGVKGYEGSEFVWAVEGGLIINGDGTDSITVRWGYNSGKYKIEVLERTISGCTNIPSDAIVELKVPVVDLGYDFVDFCQGDSVVIEPSVNMDEIYSFKWSSGDSTELTYVSDSSEVVWLYVKDTMGCTLSDTVYLTRHELPVFNLGNDTALCDMTQPLSHDLSEFAWVTWYYLNAEDKRTDALEVFPIFDDAVDTLVCVVEDYNGCRTSDTLVLLPCDVTKLFEDAQNTITPDGDGKNDTWKVPHADLFPEAELEIFDRWGRMVFRANTILEQWDGTSKGRPLPMDSYYFVIQLNAYGAKPVTGTINIVK